MATKFKDPLYGFDLSHVRVNGTSLVSVEDVDTCVALLPANEARESVFPDDRYTRLSPVRTFLRSL